MYYSQTQPKQAVKNYADCLESLLGLYTLGTQVWRLKEKEFSKIWSSRVLKNKYGNHCKEKLGKHKNHGYSIVEVA